MAKREPIMTYRGVVKGKTIELEHALPFPEGQAIQVTVEAERDTPRPGSAEAVRKFLRESTPVDRQDVEEMERLIEEGKLPVKSGGPFDDD